VAQLSQGSTFGDGGTVYMSREAVTAAFENPILNGIGCEIFRNGTGQTPVQMEISRLQQCVQLLGEILTLIKLKI